MNATIAAHKTNVSLGDSGNKCNTPFSSRCYWGEKGRSDTFTIRSKDFSDPNKPYTINISMASGLIPAEDQKEREKKGYCSFIKIRWDAKWD